MPVAEAGKQRVTHPFAALLGHPLAVQAFRARLACVKRAASVHPEPGSYPLVNNRETQGRMCSIAHPVFLSGSRETVLCFMLSTCQRAIFPEECPHYSTASTTCQGQGVPAPRDRYRNVLVQLMGAPLEERSARELSYGPSWSVGIRHEREEPVAAAAGVGGKSAHCVAAPDRVRSDLDRLGAGPW